MLRIATFLLLGSLAVSAAQAQHSRLSVFHGIQALPAAVEVFANGNKLFSFKFGEQRGPFDLTPGRYLFEVKLNGRTVLSANPTLQSGVNYSAIAHRRVGGGITLSLFVNDTAPIQPSQARLTVRHTADAPTVDVGVTSNGRPFATFRNLSNPNQVKADVPAGAYAATIFPAGSTSPVFGPVSLNLKARVSYIVYAVGALSDNSFRLIVQTIDQNLPKLSLRLTGMGCGGAIGASTLTPSWDNPFSVTLSGASANGAAWMLVGIKRMTVDLGPLGAPGCMLYNEIAAILPTTTDMMGRASLAVTPPSNLAPILPTTYWQWGFRTSANSLGWQTTRQAELVVTR